MKSIVSAGVLVAAILTTGAPGVPAEERIGSNHTVTKEQLERWKTEHSNWGRWGKEDEIGALNLITPAKRKQAAALVKEGASVSLAREAMKEKSVDNFSPYEHVMLSVGSDRISVASHGTTHTHLDALGHHSDNGKMYNDYRPTEAEVKKAGGHVRMSILNVRSGVFTRGILIDLPRLKGVPYIEPGTPIYPEDLEAFEKFANVKVSAGDALFIRVGRWQARAKLGPYDSSRQGKQAGLHASVIPWLKKRDIAVLGSEASSLVAPSDLPGAVHDFALIYLGVSVIDGCDLDAVSEAAAARKRWDFLMTLAPLPVWGATASPVNPIATF